MGKKKNLKKIMSKAETEISQATKPKRSKLDDLVDERRAKEKNDEEKLVQVETDVHASFMRRMKKKTKSSADVSQPTEPKKIILNDNADENETIGNASDPEGSLGMEVGDKFDHVESELEAMFAGSDSDAPDPDDITEPGSHKNEIEVEETQLAPNNSDYESSEEEVELSENENNSEELKPFKCRNSNCEATFKLKIQLEKHARAKHLFT